LFCSAQVFQFNGGGTGGDINFNEFIKMAGQNCYVLNGDQGTNINFNLPSGTVRMEAGAINKVYAPNPVGAYRADGTSQQVPPSVCV
jgi:hypothetical protein